MQQKNITRGKSVCLRVRAKGELGDTIHACFIYQYVAHVNSNSMVYVGG